MRTRPIAALAVLLSCLTLAACTSQPIRRPEYRPVIPAAFHTPAPVTGGLYQAETNMELFSDVKARRVGDVITVILKEKTAAKKSATTSTEKDTTLDFPNPTLFGRTINLGKYPFFDFDAASKNSFDGSGDSAQSNSLSGNITVSVAAVYPNGNMLIKGEKVMNLNQGAEVIRVSGIVRPADVTPENTILSTQIADVQITYSGEGVLAEANTQGWLARFFNGPFWPF